MISTRSALWLFYGIVFGLSWPLGWWLAIHGPYHESPLAGLLAFLPGIAGVTLSLLSGRGVGELGLFGKPSATAILLAVLAPTFAAAVSFAALAVTGIDAWRGLGAVTPAAVAIAFAKFLIGALGEEPGWRGFLQARFRERGLAYRWELAGLTWSAWHYPLLFGAAVYSSSPRPWLSAAIYTVTVTAFGVFLGWLRERSDSLWPVIVAHAVHNVWVVGLMAVVFTPGPQHRYFAGDSGVFLAAIYACMAAPLVYARTRARG